MMKSYKDVPFLQKKDFTMSGELIYKYLISYPLNYDNNPTTKWPVLLFLHGSSECGQDLDLIKVHGIPRLLQVFDDVRNGVALPSDLINHEHTNTPIVEEDPPKNIVVQPVNLECATYIAENFITVSPQLEGAEGYLWKHDLLVKLLDEIEKDNRVDRDRIYVTGLSIGGFGTFSLITNYPYQFAAAVPICGGEFAENAKLIKHIPIWVVHGKKDSVIPFKCSEEIVKELEKIGGNVKFTIYPDGDHDTWTQTYNDIEIYKWLLSQKRLVIPPSL